MDSILLSIIIPVYNLEEYIEDCLLSIQNQWEINDYPIEVLIVDDGSTDQSKNRIQPYLSDTHFKYFYQENQGVSAARNLGIKESKGTFISFVDGDDIVDSQFISTLIDELDEKTELLVFNFREFNERVEIIPLDMKDEIVPVEPGDGLNGYLKLRYQEWIRPYVFNKIYRRDIMIEHHLFFDINKKIGEDTLYNAMFIEYIHSIKTISKVLYNYRVHTSSAIHRYHSNYVKDAIQYYNSFKDISDKSSVSIDIHDYQAFYISRWFGCINNESKSKSFIKGWNNLRKFLNYEPFVSNINKIRFSDLSKKLKIYFVLMKFHCTLPIYILMYIKSHLRGA